MSAESNNLAVFVIAAIAVLVGTGCNLHYDLDTVELADGGGSDGTSDTTPPMDAVDGEDAATDADATEDSDISGDADGGDAADGSVACEIPPGFPDRTCSEDMGVLEGQCDPLGCLDECASDEECTLTLRSVNGMPDRFVGTCTLESSFGSKTMGQECQSSLECGPLALCVGWQSPDPRERVCSDICDLETGRGCDEGYYCTNPLPDTMHAYGFCTPSCDPMESDTDCPSVGETCAFDPRYPEETCEVEFQCLQVGGYSSKSEGDTCDVAGLQEDGCPPGLICVPESPGSGSGGQCQTLCEAMEDCGAGQDCTTVAGGVKICQAS